MTHASNMVTNYSLFSANNLPIKYHSEKNLSFTFIKNYSRGLFLSLMYRLMYGADFMSVNKIDTSCQAKCHDSPELTAKYGGFQFVLQKPWTHIFILLEFKGSRIYFRTLRNPIVYSILKWKQEKDNQVDIRYRRSFHIIPASCLLY